MNLLLPADYHLHTHHSGDSDAPMEKTIESAIARGLKTICITEHMDFDYPVFENVPEGLFEVDTDAYHAEHKELSSKYKDKINVRFGIELGLQPHLAERNKAYLEKYPFDFVIGSNHLCHTKDPYYPSFYEGRELKDAYIEFFESTLENIQAFDNFDVLGHLDYLVRYAPGQESNYNYMDYTDITDKILTLIIEKGKGLDVNTKALYSDPPFENPNPCKGILTRYKELGGEIITFGSDAHKPENVAGGFEKAVQIVRACGFTKYCTFSARKVEFHNL